MKMEVSNCRTTTICRDCCHFVEETPIWHGQFCGAVENAKAQNPVTGELEYVGQNDLGRVYFGANKFAFARDINKGNCEYFSRTAITTYTNLNQRS